MLPGLFTFSDSVQSAQPFARSGHSFHLMLLCSAAETLLRHSLTSNSTFSDLQMGDLFAFSVSIPGQQPLVMCSSNEKERLQWLLAFTYSAHALYLTGSVKDQMHYLSLAQARLSDMSRLALRVSRCKNRLLILPPSFRRVDKSISDAGASSLEASDASIPSSMVAPASVSKLRASSSFATVKSPPSVVYELAGREVSDCGIQAYGPRQRAAAAAAPISNLLQNMRPQTARAAEMALASNTVAAEVVTPITPIPSVQMDLKPHQVTGVAMLLLLLAEANNCFASAISQVCVTLFCSCHRFLYRARTISAQSFWTFSSRMPRVYATTRFTSSARSCTSKSRTCLPRTNPRPSPASRVFSTLYPQSKKEPSMPGFSFGSRGQCLWYCPRCASRLRLQPHCPLDSCGRR